MAIRFPRLRRGIIILAVVAGPVIGHGVYRLATAVERDRAQAHLDRRVAAAALALERELAADLEVLYAMRSPFETGTGVTSERFAAMARPLLARHPSLQALEWAPRTGRATRDDHEHSSHEEGFEGSTIAERDATGKMAATGQGEWYYPVAFVAPTEGNQDAIGVDLGSDRTRKSALDRAAATGTIALSEPEAFMQGTRPNNRVRAFLAVFANSTQMGRAGETKPVGFVAAVLRLDALLENLQAVPDGGGPANILFKLTNGGGGVIAVPGAGGDDRRRPLSLMSAEQPIDVGGQRWHLVALPTAEYMKSLRTRQPLLLGTVATVAWELLVGFVVVLGKRSRDRLERRHARLMRNILESLADGVIVADTSGKILIANTAATTISGAGPRDLSPSDWSEFYGLYDPATHELFPSDQLPLTRAIRGEATSGVDVEVKNPQVPGGTFVSVSGAPLLSGSGAIRGGVVVFRDISDRKRAEERLQRLSSAVEQTADSVLITDVNGTIQYVNPAFETTTGYTKSEALGRNPSILKSGVQGPEYYRELWDTILRGNPFRGTTVNRKKNGEFYYAEQTITGIKDRNGNITHFVSVLKDMTERRKLQEQEFEMGLAAEIQGRLFPAQAPQIAGYDLAGSVFPAEATSGDYFDFIKISDDSLTMVIADVSGHGLGPALVMAQVRAHLRSLLHATDDLVSIMDTINRFLAEDLDDNLFVTMLLVKLEPASGRCTYVNSAHPSAYVVDPSGEIAAEMSSVCLPLGFFRDRWRCTEHTVVLGEGDTMVLVTDGILESENPSGEEFGAERLLATLRQNGSRCAQEIVDQIRGAVREFVGGGQQTDDLTIVICKRLASSDSV